jgi:nitroreductase
MVLKKQIIDAFYFRHACKIFDSHKKIEDEAFNTILEAGRLSPSSFGFEPWRFLIVQNPELREKLREVTWGAQETLPTASHFIVLLVRKQKEMRYDSDYIEHMMYDIHHLTASTVQQRREKYMIFQKEDLKLLESERATFDWAAKQSYIALANMMTTAAMLGIDSCPIEGFHAEKLEQLMSEAFDIDVERFGVAVMAAFGYRLHPQRPKTRQSMNDIVQWY